MSEKTYDSVAKEAGELAYKTAIDVAWKQWSCLGASGVATSQDISSIVDPEALVLLSMQVRHRERRLADFAAWLAEVGPGMLSVQRMKTLVDRFPASAERDFEAFARFAVNAGDRRWKRYADSDDLVTARSGKGAADLNLREDPTLMFRLRAGFGVSAKADVLTYLLGMNGRSRTVRSMSDATGYTEATIRSAAGEMALARLIRESAGRPVHYHAEVHPWAELLHARDREGPEQMPSWRHWASLFAFLSHVVEWQQSERERSAYVQSSKARTLVEQHLDALEANRISIPDPYSRRGEAYLEDFLRTMRAVTDWIRRHV